MTKPSDLVTACRRLYSAIETLDYMVAASARLARSDLRALNCLERGPKTAGEIARELDLKTGSVTTLIDRLEAKGLARRESDPKDRRKTLVVATDRAFQDIGGPYAQVARALVAAGENLPREELAQAVAHLNLAAQCYEEVVAEDETS